MYLRTLLSFAVSLLLLPALVVALVDPMGAWHERWVGGEFYSTEQRYGNIGLITRQIECGSCTEATVLLGTSMSENTTRDLLTDVTGAANPVRLLMQGAYPVEHDATLRRALRSGRVKTVYWEIYQNYASESWNVVPQSRAFPEFLYDESLANDGPYLLSHDVFVESLAVWTGTSKWPTSANATNRWSERLVKRGAFEEWNSKENVARQRTRCAERRANFSGTTPNWHTPVPAYEKIIRPLVDAHPEIHFVFFTPPVSLIRQSEHLGPSLSGQLVIRRRIAELSAHRANIEIYGFDDYFPLVSDMAFYKDSGHYFQAINRFLLERMVDEDERFALTAENAEERGEALWQRVVAYRPNSSCLSAAKGAQERCARHAVPVVEFPFEVAP